MNVSDQTTRNLGDRCEIRLWQIIRNWIFSRKFFERNNLSDSKIWTFIMGRSGFITIKFSRENPRYFKSHEIFRVQLMWTFKSLSLSWVRKSGCHCYVEHFWDVILTYKIWPLFLERKHPVYEEKKNSRESKAIWKKNPLPTYQLEK